MARRTRLAILGAAALLAFGLAVVAAIFWWFPRFEPDPSRYPVRGIDVSHHQGAIDWRAVAADNVTFAYLKASEGADHSDDRFAENWRAARAAGLRVGAYHYFTLCRSGRKQAENFLAATPRAADALPAAVDLEFGGNCGARPDGAAMRRQVDDFLDAVEARDGKPAIFYVTPEFWAAYGPDLPQRRIWRRSIVLRPERPWTLWQFHNRGQVKGVRAPVDLNVFDGDRAAFARFAAASS